MVASTKRMCLLYFSSRKAYLDTCHHYTANTNWNTHLVLYKNNPAQTRVTKMKASFLFYQICIYCDDQIYIYLYLTKQKTFTFYEVLI